MPVVKFVKENKQVEVADGTSIRNAARQAGINTNQGVNGIGASINKFANCFGMGVCGTCRVKVVRGMERTSPMTIREKFKFKTPFGPDPIPCLAFIGNEDTMRLACVTKVHGDIEVETGPEVNLFGENFFS